MARIIDFSRARAALRSFVSEDDVENPQKQKEWGWGLIITALVFLGVVAVLAVFGAGINYPFSKVGWQINAIVFFGLWFPGMALVKVRQTLALWLASLFILSLFLRIIFW